MDKREQIREYYNELSRKCSYSNIPEHEGYVEKFIGDVLQLFKPSLTRYDYALCPRCGSTYVYKGTPHHRGDTVVCRTCTTKFIIV